MNDDAENKLEKLLRQAFEKPAFRPEFYRVLLQSTVYVISRRGLKGNGGHALKRGEGLDILTVPAADDMVVIPFFSSLERLAQFLEEDGEYIGLNARHLFELTRGNTLVLNPGSDSAKGFDSTEIDNLLKTGVHHDGQSSSPPPQSRVLSGPPEPYPSAMVDALTTFFATRPQVKAACLAVGQADDDHSVHLVLGIDADGDVPSILQQATAVAVDTAPLQYAALALVDLRRKGDDTVTDLLRYGICFYERRWGARLSTVAGRA